MQLINHTHPKSLAVFFTTEMWERYGFYVVQTLLALYLALHFKWPDNRVYALVGSFTALTYLSPIIGGWIADQLLGQSRSIVLGMLCLLVSYWMLSQNSTYHEFIAALAGVAVGTGLVKSNISSLLGNTYTEHSPHRERGFTIFYLGITSGIILGTTVPSYLYTHFGWHMPFTSATLGIVLALLIFSRGIRKHAITDYYPHPFSLIKLLQANVLIGLLWWGIYCILIHPLLANLMFIAVVILSIGYLLHCIRTEPPEQAKKTTIIALLCCISVIFWAFYFQMFLSFTLFIVRVIQPNLYGLAIPAPYYVTIESISMLLLGVFFAKRSNLSHDNKHTAGVRASIKFTRAIGIITLAYLIMIAVINHSLTSVNALSPLYIIPIYVCIALAELLLSPVGLSTITILSSRKKVSTMMGLFFVSLGLGGFLAGKLAGLTAIDNQTSLANMKTAYLHSFELLFTILCITLLVTLGINRFIRQLCR